MLNTATSKRSLHPSHVGQYSTGKRPSSTLLGLTSAANIGPELTTDRFTIACTGTLPFPVFVRVFRTLGNLPGGDQTL
jgi:hypothetical protein